METTELDPCAVYEFCSLIDITKDYKHILEKTLSRCG